MSQSNFHVCFHCKDRKIGCHGSCQLYQAEKAESERTRMIRNEQRGIDNTLYNNAGHRMSTSNRKS
jgi:hypothetical protein